MKIINLLKPRIYSLKNILKKMGLLQILVFVSLALLFFSGLYQLIVYFLAKVDVIPVLSSILKWRLLNMVIFAFFWMMFLSTVISSIGSIFGSEDLPLLMSSPLSHLDIFIAKFLESLFISGLISTVILIVMLMAFASSYGGLYNFLPAIFLTIPPFVFISAALATVLSLVIGRFFSVKTARSIFQIIFVCAAIGLVFFIRSLEPEKLFLENDFVTIASYLKDLSTPGNSWSPSVWVSNTLIAFFAMNYREILLNLGKLYSAAIFSGWLLIVLGRKIYFKGFLRFQESVNNIQDNKKLNSRFMELISGIFPFGNRPAIWKDLIIFVRTPVLSTQLMMLWAVAGIYIYNIILLPVKHGKVPWTYLCKMFGFLNIGMTGFIVSAACLRFVYPVLAIEGKNFYLIRVSPVSTGKYLYSKLVLFSSGFIIFAFSLTFGGVYLLKPGFNISLMSYIDCVFLTIGIVSFNLGIGILFPNTGISSVTEAPASVGGLVSMIVSTVYIIIVLMFQTPFLFERFTHYFIFKFSIGINYSILWKLSLGISFLLIIAGWLIPLVMAWKKLESGEGI